MDIVTDLEPLGAGSRAAGNVAEENILGVLNQGSAVVFVVVLVER
jgi:hypothetical protein